MGSEPILPATRQRRLAVETPFGFADAGQGKGAVEDRAVEDQVDCSARGGSPAVISASGGPGAAIDDADPAGAILHGAFVPEEPQRVIEDPLGANRVRASASGGLSGRLLEPQRSQSARGGFQHEIPVYAFGSAAGGVFLDDESLAFHGQPCYHTVVFKQSQGGR